MVFIYRFNNISRANETALVSARVHTRIVREKNIFSKYISISQILKSARITENQFDTTTRNLFVTFEFAIKMWKRWVASSLSPIENFPCATRIDPLSRERSYVLSARIPSVPDPDVLHTYLANRDTAAIPKIPTRSRPFGLRAKLGMGVVFTTRRTYPYP